MSIAFVFGFGSLLVVNSISANSTSSENQNNFFQETFPSNKNKIFLVGSSHIGHLNMDYINKKINSEYPNYNVYNLAINSDHPKSRYNNIEELISLNPSLVFYGISFRDFESKFQSSSTENFSIENLVPNLQQSTKETYSKFDLPNPQLITKKIIRTILDETGIQKAPVYDIQPQNTPFFSLGSQQTIILDDLELERLSPFLIPEPSTLNINIENNEDEYYLRQIISKLQENNIKVILFTTPLSKAYLNSLNHDAENNFNDILDSIENDFDLVIYDFTDKYSELQVWTNPDHIAYNDKSMQFSEDIKSIIQKEIDS